MKFQSPVISKIKNCKAFSPLGEKIIAYKNTYEHGAGEILQRVRHLPFMRLSSIPSFLYYPQFFPEKFLDAVPGVIPEHQIHK